MSMQEKDMDDKETSLFPLVLSAVYGSSRKPKPSNEAELFGNREHPEWNTLEYEAMPFNHTKRMYDAWEAFSLTKDEQLILATNKYSGRRTGGWIWGFANLDDQSEEAASYNLECKSLITDVEFVADDIVLISMYDGTLQVWSTHSKVRNPENPYCLFKIHEKLGSSATLCAQVTKLNRSKAVTGHYKGDIMIWDYGSSQIKIIQHYDKAHKTVLFGLDTSHENENIFATSSHDSSAFIWDARQQKPATRLYAHTCGLKAIAWASPFIENGENILYMGDDVGRILVVDKRKPHKLLNRLSLFEKPVRRILPKGTNIAFIADTNELKIYDTLEQKLIYDKTDYPGYLRQGIWRNDEELLVVGFNTKLLRVKLQPKE